MAKRIVMCTDGTWDDPQKATNVALMHDAAQAIPGVQQVLYNDGVGVNGTPVHKLLGGAFGAGLFERVKRAYGDIAAIYNSGDEIFIFGFSRGAYTARSVAGMIAVVGLPTRPTADGFVDDAFAAYRERDPAERKARLEALAPFALEDAKITMLGVWDTVGALGIPAMFGATDSLIYGFLDTTLHPDVLNAYHALAIDERRVEFTPTLWTSPAAPGRTMQQVWFAGVHCDVGGSYAETFLSDITLGWMMRKASGLGLQFSDAAKTRYFMARPQSAVGAIHESWSAVWGVCRHRDISGDACLSDSVVLRCAGLSAYRPVNLTFAGTALAKTYSVMQVVEGAEVV